MLTGSGSGKMHQEIDTYCDVVCFESGHDDEHGAHSIIPLEHNEGAWEVGAFPFSRQKALASRA